VIVIDTHIWIWWVHDHPDLRPWMRQRLIQHEADGIGVSAISCWEIARLVSGGRLDVGRPIEEWLAAGLAYPGVQLIDLSPEISIDSNYLPGEFHKDPADRIIVATARVCGCELLTADQKILDYPEVRVARATA
jgi:PIN domain nuclease of toxin-antitoxin system